MSGLNKITVERNQRAVLEIAAQPGNDICADCKARNPRWASHNLGIFICVNCASVHRKIGTHITKVKSLTLDSWTKEQVENMRNNGNLKSNQHFNPNEIRHPPPPPMMESERDSELEQYIRSKYEYKRFIDRSAVVAAHLGPSRSASSVAPRTRPAPATAGLPAALSKKPNFGAVLEHRPSTTAPGNTSRALGLMAQTEAGQLRSVSQPLSSQPQPQALPPPQPPQSQVWDDLVSLQTPTSNASLPLQMAQPTQPFTIPNSNLLTASNPNQYGVSISPGYPSSLQTQMTMPSDNSPIPSFTPQGYNGLGSGINANMLNPYQQQSQQYSNNPSPVFPTQNTQFLQQQQQPQQQQQYSTPTIPSAPFGMMNGNGSANVSPMPPFSQPSPYIQQQQQQQYFPTQTPQAPLGQNNYMQPTSQPSLSPYGTPSNFGPAGTQQMFSQPNQNQQYGVWQQQQSGYPGQWGGM